MDANFAPSIRAEESRSRDRFAACVRTLYRDCLGRNSFPRSVDARFPRNLRKIFQPGSVTPKACQTERGMTPPSVSRLQAFFNPPLPALQFLPILGCLVPPF